MKKTLLAIPFALLLTACGTPSVDDLIEDKATMLPISKYKLPIQNILIYTKFKKQLNQKTPLSTTQIFNKTILKATAKDRQALVIVDRAGWHMTKAIRCFSNVTLLPLPPYSPELNHYMG
jgi:hypothetical protein